MRPYAKVSFEEVDIPPASHPGANAEWIDQLIDKLHDAMKNGKAIKIDVQGRQPASVRKTLHGAVKARIRGGFHAKLLKDQNILVAWIDETEYNASEFYAKQATNGGHEKESRTCGACGESGHNRRKCPQLAQPA